MLLLTQKNMAEAEEMTMTRPQKAGKHLIFSPLLVSWGLSIKVYIFFKIWAHPFCPKSPADCQWLLLLGTAEGLSPTLLSVVCESWQIMLAAQIKIIVALPKSTTWALCCLEKAATHRWEQVCLLPKRAPQSALVVGLFFCTQRAFVFTGEEEESFIHLQCLTSLQVS